MNRFLRAGENGGLLTDCRELSPNHTASSSSSSSSTASSISITSSSSSCCSSAAGSADRHAALPSLQTRGPGGGGGSGGSEPRRSALKRSRAGREGREEPEAAAAAAAADQSAAAVVVRGGGGEVCVGVGKQQQQRREAQGRSVGGEVPEMISAVSRDADGGGSGSGNNNNGVSEVTTASPATCAKGREERKGKNMIRGWKRERDREREAAAPPAAPPAAPVRTRKEKPGDGSSPPPSVFLPSSALPEHHLCRDGPGHCHCASPDSRIMGDNSNTNNVNNNNNSGSNGGGAASKSALDCGVKSGGGAIVVRRQHDDTPAAKKHRGAEKLGSAIVPSLSKSHCLHPWAEYLLHERRVRCGFVCLRDKQERRGGVEAAAVCPLISIPPPPPSCPSLQNHLIQSPAEMRRKQHYMQCVPAE
ncbi:zinc finger protein 608-like isoform X1 [Lates japonicus]|uniref:Zinc finger protein 608-like isoform X1 n=2 Tax=Lates japonicus TaxID=270547 RepID=A0AAD3NFY7_LATJO|nr:zinc finger protein 608-like isoform X1 [Lates japonicus]